MVGESIQVYIILPKLCVQEFFVVICSNVDYVEMKTINKLLF